MDEKLRKVLRLLGETDVIIAVFDEDDRLVFANRKYRTAFFLSETELPLWPDMMRRNFDAKRGTVITNPDFDLWIKSTLSRRGKVPFRAFETDVHDGTWLWMTETVDDDGWMLCIASDITNLRTQERSLRRERDVALQASLTDDLTGIANHRFIMDRLANMLARRPPARSAQGCFAIFDVDNFKQINDRFGHATGDRLLIEFARSISLLVRRTDCFGRLGGEEFGLVLPSTSLNEAASLIDRMINQIRSLRPMPDLPDFSFSFSAGLAAVSPADTPSGIYGRADAALYHAKHSGRDQLAIELTPGPPNE
ncbi:sensor domain-containing diguanylate cyclase [Martelella sp. HB161492]|uniref:sensor domain-containing diguanylate cyclase n=1 Tax=Martelella sp. HB161492 TaxID=2720726 RepID=UPI00159259C7|nr:sensor domain-containing diguanylate cyclase [Martelella sp. HB161492]